MHLDNPQDLHQAVLACMHNPAVRDAIAQLYSQIASALDQIRPNCEMSGRCCRFEDFGHRLFLTTAELAVFTADAQSSPAAQSLLTQLDEGGCRFQQSRLCCVHAIRPLGCRLFFCDSPHEAQLQQLYEQMHKELREIHDRLGVRYFYVEWRQGLTAIQDLCRTPLK